MMKRADLIRCPHCKEEVSAATDFCPACSRILPPSGLESYYETLGYDREFLTVDLNDLEKRFFELSKKFHPDRFANKSQLEIQLSHDRSSLVNNAYRTLKDPIARAKYLVERIFGSIEEKSAKVPMEMADLFFEVQDLLDTIRDSNDKPPEQTVKDVQIAEQEFMKKVKGLEGELQKKFVEYDAGDSRETLEKIKEILSQRSYIKSFLRQIDSVMNEKVEDRG